MIGIRYFLPTDIAKEVKDPESVELEPILDQVSTFVKERM